MRSYGIFSFAVSLIMIALLTFAVLQGLQIPVGNFMDWLIGIGTFAWLMTIVTVPWNIHFEALEVLNESKTSKKKNINFDASQLPYVRRLYFWSLVIAVALHLISAGGLYYLAWANISVVGYYGAGAAILLTFLRPAVRAYEYISRRLASIREEIFYPREDMYLLKMQWEDTKIIVEDLQKMLSLDENSWYSNVEQKHEKFQQTLNHLQDDVQKLDKDNQSEHERIAKETRQAVAQLTEDGKFIDNLVEIIRFIKKV